MLNYEDNDSFKMVDAIRTIQRQLDYLEEIEAENEQLRHDNAIMRELLKKNKLWDSDLLKTAE